MTSPRTSALRIATIATIAAVALTVPACSDDDAASSGGDSDMAASDAQSDVRTLSDAEVDATASLDTDVVDLVDAEGNDDASDAGPTDSSQMNVDLTVADDVGDAGTDCSENADLCTAPFECMQGICTLDPGAIAFAEQSYTFREPEELSHVFNLIKSFAGNVAFFTVEVSGNEGDPWRRPARYGTSDRHVHPETNEVVYTWQFPEDYDRFVLTPVRGEGGLQGHVWESNIFQWSLKAEVRGSFEVEELIGFIAEQTRVLIRFEQDFQSGVGEFSGIITRQEAESRVLGASAFEPFRAVICRVDPDWQLRGEQWTLADILDCNGTPMDVDLNGDGVLDGYRALLDFVIQPATLVTPEELDL